MPISRRIPKGNFPLDEAWDLQDATEKEVQAAREHYIRTGECDHTLVEFEGGFLYDRCSCVVCHGWVDYV